MNDVTSSIEIEAPPQEVFNVVSDLAAWPRRLPHYRWIRVLENHPNHQVVRMACYRGWIPIDWVSRFHIDAQKKELHFDHLKAFTQGMHVVWQLDPIRDGTATRVTIIHEMKPVVQRWGRFIAERILAGFFINYVAPRTLKCFASYFTVKKSKTQRASS